MSIPSTLLSDKTVQSVKHSVFDLRRPLDQNELEALIADTHAWRIARQLKQDVGSYSGEYTALSADIQDCIRLTDQRICCAECEADLLGRISYAEASRQKRIWRRVRADLKRQLNQATIMAVRQQGQLRHAQT